MIDGFLDRAARALELALGLGFIFAILLNFTNVIGRYVFGVSLLWADEVQIFILVAMTFLGAVVVTWRRAHLRMDALVRIMPPGLQKALRVVEMIVMSVLCGFVFVQARDYTSRMYDFGRVSDSAGVPMWIPHGALAVGFGLIFLISLWHGWRAIRPVPGAPPGAKNDGAR